MTEQEVLKILAGLKAVLTGHFVGNSGLHLASYVNKDTVFPYTLETSRLCREIALRFVNDGVYTVIGPTVGGVILSNNVAHQLTLMRRNQVFGVYAEKMEGKFVIGRGYKQHVTDQDVLVVEDILTTGGSVKKVIEAVREAGGNVIGVGALCNRGGVTAVDLGDVPKLVSLVNITMDKWTEEECPLCKKGIPINTEVGHGAEYLQKKLSTPIRSVLSL